jgi:surfactin synthase thioesterase subunit
VFNKKIYKLIEDIEYKLSNSNLDDWTYKFLHDIQSSLIDGDHLTPKQISKCREILSGG